MSQTGSTAANLQLHHNFRWVLCANHVEPVKGFLGRYLQRRLTEDQVLGGGGVGNEELAKIVGWLPTVWQHLNRFLENYSSSDVTIGAFLIYA